MAEYNALITDPARRAAREAEAFYWGTTLANPHRDAGELDRLDLGDCEIRVFPSPGHTATNLSIFVPGDGVLFCGDCLTNRYAPSLTAGGVEDWKQWLQSLDRIQALAPEIVVPGHGPVVVGAAELRRVIQNVRETLEKSIAAVSPARPARYDCCSWTLSPATSDGSKSSAGLCSPARARN